MFNQKQRNRLALSIWLPLILILGSSVVFAETQVLKTRPIMHRTPEEIGAILLPLLDERDHITSNGQILIIKTSSERWPHLQQLIDRLDAPASNLIITVIQDRYRSAESFNAAARLKIQGHSTDKGTDIRGRVHADFSQHQGHADFYNRHTVRTSEGRPAHIKVGKVRPVKRRTHYYSRYGHPEVHESIDFFEVSTGFAVTPRLVGKDQVLLDVAPWSDRFVHRGVIETQGAQTQLRVNLGEWVEIGTVNRQHQQQHSGIGKQAYRLESDVLHIVIKVEKAP